MRSASDQNKTGRSRDDRHGLIQRTANGFRTSLLLVTVLVFFFALAFAPIPTTADRGADGEYDERSSSHFTLFQDVDIDTTSGFYGSRQFEQQILEILEAGYRNLDASLGMRPSRTITVTIHDPNIFQERFAGIFRFPAAGFYGGTIHIRGDIVVSDRLVAVLHHELVHAAFDAVLPNTALPAWFNEGVAEWFSAQALRQSDLLAWQSDALSKLAARGELLRLAELSSRSLGHLGPNAAQWAYLQSYGFVNYLAHVRGERRLRDLCRQLVRTGDLDDALRRVYRNDLTKLEQGFAEVLGGSSY
ncbi:MAG: hypothetical protein ACI9QQ_001371 [Myxococcota bacterium]|jgi:hypothetical protein